MARTTSQNDSTPIATIRIPRSKPAISRRASSTASSSPATARRIGFGENGGGEDGEGGGGEGGGGGGPAHSLALGTSEAATLLKMGQGHSSPG